MRLAVATSGERKAPRPPNPFSPSGVVSPGAEQYSIGTVIGQFGRNKTFDSFCLFAPQALCPTHSFLRSSDSSAARQGNIMANEPSINDETQNILSALSNPQFKGIIAIAVVLGMLLLFARDLADPSGFRNYLIGALTIYLISTIFLVQLQINLIGHARNQAGESPEHFPSFQKSLTCERRPRIARLVNCCEDFANVLGWLTNRCIPLLHGTLLVLLILYLFWRKCL